ncbi:MAG: hypothetical protein MSA34_00135 [Firmicutes bacterium]|nr:hypothetical protein [Bacillota bacterium]MDY5586075.1 hypothetical protein [Eubacteriales bacterium]
MKLKKKSIAAFIFAICLVMPAILLFAACGKTEHTFSSEWSTTDSQHWHACTDENCDEKSDLGDHNFVWVEKTPAGVHTDRVETGTCSICQYQKDRTIEGSGLHTWEWKTSDTKHWQETTCEHETPLKQNEQDHTWESKSDATKHWEQTTCTQHDTIKRNEEAHTWEWKANNAKHWEQTTCAQHEAKTRNEENHIWEYTSEGELTHRRTTNCGAEKHATRIEPNIPHRYTDENDVDCNDCGYVRSLTGKGSFNTLSAKTYNAGAQGVASSDYTVNEAIKDLCEIQYKVKDANDSTYTTTAPTNAGTYEVRIYCRGNATYLRGEVAKAEFVINKYEVEIVSGLTFNVAYDKAAMEDANVQYIDLGTVHVTKDLVKPADVSIKAKKKDAFKNPGRYQVYDDEMLIEDDNFALKKLTDLRKVNLVYYDDSVAATLTSVADESKIKWDATKKQVGITVVRVNNGTIRVGDYMICEGYTKPLKVVALKLQYSVPTDMLINGDKNCEIYFDNSSFADLATAKPILANKTFTEVETLNFVEGENYTNTVSRQLNKGECFYLAFATEASAIVKTYKLNFDTNGTGYETSGSVYFFRTDGYTDTAGIELNTKSEGIYFVKVTKTADSEPGKESVDFSIKKW